MFDVAIIGGGPAGLSAAVNACAEGLETVLIAETFGGQAGDSSRIENYAGFPDGISGPELTDRMMAQARKFGVVFVEQCVKAIEPREDYFRIGARDTTAEARAVIIATGANYNKLPVAAPYEGKGVHYSCNQQTVKRGEGNAVVVGGGNNSGQAALFLSDRGKHVHFVIKDDNLDDSMSDYLCERINNTRTITLHKSCEITNIEADEDHVAYVDLNNGTGLNCTDIYVMIGSSPNTGLIVRDALAKVDEHDFIATTDNYCTDLPGLYAIGDCRAESVKRVANAVGEGAAVVAHVYKYLDK